MNPKSAGSLFDNNIKNLHLHTPSDSYVAEHDVYYVGEFQNKYMSKKPLENIEFSAVWVQTTANVTEQVNGAPWGYRSFR